MSGIYQEANKAGKDAVAEDGRWLVGVPAIVAKNNDPEQQHRVKVIIPSIDENMIYDEWVRPSAFCLGNGFGSVFIPPIGSEVWLIGELGQKYSLFFVSTFNEEMLIPSELSETSAGIHAPNNLIFIADQLSKMKGEIVKIEAMQLAKIESNQIEIDGGEVTIDSDGKITIKGGNIAITGDSITLHNRVVNKTGGSI